MIKVFKKFSRVKMRSFRAKAAAMSYARKLKKSGGLVIVAGASGSKRRKGRKTRKTRRRSYGSGPRNVIM